MLNSHAGRLLFFDFPRLLPEFSGTDSHGFSEQISEIVAVRETAGQRDVRYGAAGGEQGLAGFFQAYLIEIFFKAKACGFFEFP